MSETPPPFRAGQQPEVTFEKPSDEVIESLGAPQQAASVRAGSAIAASTLALGCLLAVFRTLILRADFVDLTWWQSISMLGQAWIQDALFVSVFGVVSFLISKIFAPTGVARIHKWTCAVLAIWGAANVAAVEMLSEPVTWAWITYADILNSSYAFDAIFHQVDSVFIAGVLGVLLAFLALQLAIFRALMRGRSVTRNAFGVVVLPLAVGVALFAIGGEINLLSRGEKLNPYVALAQSFVAPPKAGGGLIEEVDSEALPPPPDVAMSPQLERPDTAAHPIRNVVLFVLESTPARFVEDYGGPHPITPNLTAYSDMAIRIERAYAPTPASNYSLFGLTTSVLPEMKAISPQQRNPDHDYLALADVLSAQGFRTGFFASTDNRFEHREDFLAHAGYQSIEDYRNWNCDKGFFGAEGAGYHNSVPDRCTVPPVLDWIDDSGAAPFFATFWTGQPHYPYSVEGEPKPFTGHENKDRFLTALSETDRAFGLFMEGLAERGLQNDTLVVVVGDHGEAFGEHGTNGHASAVYEETLRVPLYLINPHLFDGQAMDRLAVTVDLAPTILDLLGLEAPDIWQGRSLFSENHRNGTIFFSPWNGFLTGFVEGHTKLIYNASTEEFELYDLSNDPLERKNLAPEQPEAIPALREKLAQWLTWQAAISTRYAKQKTTQQAPEAPIERRISLYATGTYFKTYPRATISIDGDIVGAVQVSNAPNNAELEITREEEKSAMRQYFIDNTADRCARKLSITFENDEWAGEGLTGDTNLTIKWVELDGAYYTPKQFRLETANAGGIWQDSFTMWRSGTFTVDLAPPADCVSSSLAQQEN